MLSQLTNLQEDLLSLKQEIISEKMSFREVPEDENSSALSYPLEELPF